MNRLPRVMTLPFAMLCLSVAAGCGQESAVNNSNSSASNAIDHDSPEHLRLTLDTCASREREASEKGGAD